MFSKKSNPFKKFVENTNKLAQTLQPPQQNSSEKSVIKKDIFDGQSKLFNTCLLYTSPSPRDLSTSRMPSSA